MGHPYKWDTQGIHFRLCHPLIQTSSYPHKSFNSHPMAPIDTAIESYKAQLQLPEEDRMSIRALATENGVSTSTLHRRVSGTSVARNEAHIHRQTLTVDEEKALVEYICRWSISGHPPPPHDVISIALELLNNRVSLLPPPNLPQSPYLGHTWLGQFRRRHPEVATVWSRNLDTTRLKANSPEKLAPYFAEVGSLMTQHAYPPSRMFNMDETGFAIGAAARSTRVLTIMEGPKRKKANQASSGRQEWVTSIECVSAAGKALPPLVIFKGTTVMHDAWIPTGVDTTGWRWRVSNKGWSSDTLAFDWLSNIFEPQTRPLPPLDPSTRRLLIVDGHGSHMRAQFIVFCMQHAIDLAILPSHSSHLTQPLDVGIFGPLKQSMSRQAVAAARIHDGRVTKAVWAAQLAVARKEAMTEPNIRVGWRKTGLYPFAPSKLISVVEPPSQPPPSTPPPARTPLASIQSQNCDFIRDHGSIMTTPIKRHCNSLADGFGACQTELEMLRKEIRDAKASQAPQKKPRAGMTVGNLGTHILTNDVTLGQVTASEVVRLAKKGKGKQRAVQADSPGPSEHPPTFHSDLRAFLDG